MLKNYLLIAVTLLFFSFASAAPFSNSAASSSFTGTSGFQYTNPTFSGLYSSSDIGMYWPQLADNIENDRCEGNTDFLVMIPPGGCSPAVVRSDLLADQNVPVFCQLQSAQVNPLIKVSSIKSISFKGKYPNEIAGVSFYPARAALRSYTTLLNSPVVNNIGYVVIILKKTANESAMAKLIKGNLTATMYYDAEKAFGVGSSEFYLQQMNEDQWQQDKFLQSFWQGRGLLRLVDIQNDKATVEVLTKDGDVVRTMDLKVGETSGLFYFPGFYCRAALKVKLNEISSPEDSVILNVDGVQMEARKNTKLGNTGCRVTSVNVIAGDTGVAKISCGGKNLDLSLLNMYQANFTTPSSQKTADISSNIYNDDQGNSYYFAYSGFTKKIISGQGDNAEYAVLIKSSKALDNSIYSELANKIDATFQNPTGQELTKEFFISHIKPTNIDAKNVILLFKGDSADGIKFIELVSSEGKSLSPEASVTKDVNAEIATNYFDKGDEVLNELLDQYSTLKNQQMNYGETALLEQIDLINRIQQKGINYEGREIELMNKFLELYPESAYAEDINQKLILAQRTDSTNAYKTVYSNNEYHSIGIVKFKPAQVANKSFELIVNNKNVRDEQGSVKLHELDTINLSKLDNNEGNDHLIVKTISNKEVVVDYYRLETSNGVKTTKLFKTVSLPFNTNSNVEVKPQQLQKGETKDSYYNVYLSDVSVEKIAYVSIISELKTKSEANFTFNIGVEQRAIEIAPEKAKSKAAELNKTIADWEAKNKKLGDLVTKWKGVCLATGLAMQVKNLVMGFSGESMARQNVMQVYKNKCSQGTINPETNKEFVSIDMCYNYYSNNISKDVDAYKIALQKVNDDIEKTYHNNISEFQASGCKVNVNGREVTSNQISAWGDARQCLLYNELKGSSTATVALMKDVETRTYGQLGYIAQTAEANQQINEITDELPPILKPTYVTFEPTNTGGLGSGGNFNSNFNVNNYAPVEYSDLVSLISDDSAAYLSGLSGTLGITTTKSGGMWYLMIVKTSSGSQVVDGIYNFTTDKTSIQNINKVNSIAQTNGVAVTVSALGGKCSFKYKTPSVRYYDSDPNKGLPAIVPIDLNEGWYVFVPQSQGGILSDSVQGYQASGAVQFYYLCNVGPNGVEEKKQGDDICQSFSINNNNVEAFRDCAVSSQKINILKSKAQSVIREVGKQYANGIRKINIASVGNDIPVDAGLSGDANMYQCQDFMSVDDCKILYNVCDPVICPTSRCNFGGKLPVANVIQSGIIGSMVLCSKNFVLFGGDVFVPICLTGIHAGIEGYVSILKAEQKCLTEYAASGKHTGICDEMTAVYKCEFFWRQVSPLMQNLIPSLAEFVYYGKWNKQSGGGEYATFQKSWDNMQQSIDYFKNTYASTSFTAFKFGNVEDIGTSFCQNFIGTSLPTSGKALDAMLKPESPAQFYGKFSEIKLTEATVPATAQYKVFYHIYAGTDLGARYTVYLKNPPTTSYYSIPQQVHVKSGYLATGEQATESIDFTAPAGYKEMCLVINSDEECGFQAVSTEFTVNALHDLYAQEQGAQNNITTEKECISGTPSLLALANTNVQAGAEEAVNPDIAMRGIVRVCATSSPGKSTSSSQWTAVGYCGDQKLTCWLDQSSVDTDAMNVLKKVKLISAAEDVLSNDSGTTQLYSDMQKSAEQINMLKNNVSNLKFTANEVTSISAIDAKIKPLVDLAIQANTYSYLDAYKAEALLSHYRIYRQVVIAILDLKTEKSAGLTNSITAPTYTGTPTSATQTTTTIDDVIWNSVTGKITVKGFDDGYVLKKGGSGWILSKNGEIIDRISLSTPFTYLAGYSCTFTGKALICRNLGQSTPSSGISNSLSNSENVDVPTSVLDPNFKAYATEQVDNQLFTQSIPSSLESFSSPFVKSGNSVNSDGSIVRNNFVTIGIEDKKIVYSESTTSFKLENGNILYKSTVVATANNLVIFEDNIRNLVIQKPSYSGDAAKYAKDSQTFSNSQIVKDFLAKTGLSEMDMYNILSFASNYDGSTYDPQKGIFIGKDGAPVDSGSGAQASEMATEISKQKDYLQNLNTFTSTLKTYLQASNAANGL